MKPHIHRGPFGWTVHLRPGVDMAHAMLAENHARRLQSNGEWLKRTIEQQIDGIAAVMRDFGWKV